MNKRKTDAIDRPVDPVELGLEAARRRVDPRKLPAAVRAAIRLTWQASRRGVVQGAALQVIGALAVSGLVAVGQLALETLLAVDRGAAAPSSLVLVFVLIAVVTAVSSAATTLQRQHERLLSEQVSTTVWQRLLDVTGRVSLEFFESPAFYNRLQRVQANAVLRPITVTTSVLGIVGSATGTVGLLIVLLAIDPLLVPMLVLAGVPAVVLSRRASRTEFAFATRTVPTYRAREYLRKALTSREEAKEVRAFGAERVLRGWQDDHSAAYTAALGRHVRTRQAYALFGVATTSIALALSLALLAGFVMLGRISLADAGAAALGIRFLSTRLEQLFQSVGVLVESSVFLEDLDLFLDLAGAADQDGTGSAPSFRDAVTVNAVSYAYPGCADNVLTEVSLTIRPGEVVAIVGESGSGKTTLAKILAGLYPPGSGSVKWDGTDVRELSPADVRRGVAVIFQDFVRYQLSAEQNIGIGDPCQVDDVGAVRDAARRAGAAGFLEELPAGYETILSKEFAGGFDLSVGQWQRVALARALRRPAPLVILDEPSSALDPRAEQELFADMRATLQGRAAVLISHRYSTVRSADRIYVMRHGRVVESGTHDELMMSGGLYLELFTLQARAYS